MVVFGIGAGLRPGELVALRGSDVARRGRRVVARVAGPRPRLVPVAPRCCRTLKMSVAASLPVSVCMM